MVFIKNLKNVQKKLKNLITFLIRVLLTFSFCNPWSTGWSSWPATASSSPPPLNQSPIFSFAFTHSDCVSGLSRCSLQKAKFSAGTFGEAQISALKNQQVFVWLNKGLKMSNISPWLFPSITKILKDDELWPFLENFK